MGKSAAQPLVATMPCLDGTCGAAALTVASARPPRQSGAPRAEADRPERAPAARGLPPDQTRHRSTAPALSAPPKNAREMRTTTGSSLYTQPVAQTRATYNQETPHMSETETPHELPECWQAATDCLAVIPRVILYGPPGTGKTYYALTHKPAGTPAYRVICTDDMTTAQIEGMFVPRAEGWHYAEGAAIQAWRTGGRLVIDEVNRANGDVLSMLLAMTDTQASSVWQHPDTGEQVRPAEGYSVVMTMNGEPDDLDSALLDRFPVAVRINEPHPDAVALLPDKFQNAARFAADLPPNERVSIRALMAVSQLAERYGMARALDLVLPADAEQVRAALEVSDLGRVV